MRHACTRTCIHVHASYTRIAYTYNIYLSIDLSINQSIYLCVYPSIYPHTQTTHTHTHTHTHDGDTRRRLRACLHVLIGHHDIEIQESARGAGRAHLAIHLSIYLSIYRPIYLSIYPSIHLSIYLIYLIYLSIYLHACVRIIETCMRTHTCTCIHAHMIHILQSTPCIYAYTHAPDCVCMCCVLHEQLPQLAYVYACTEICDTCMHAYMHARTHVVYTNRIHVHIPVRFRFVGELVVRPPTGMAPEAPSGALWWASGIQKRVGSKLLRLLLRPCCDCSLPLRDQLRISPCRNAWDHATEKNFWLHNRGKNGVNRQSWRSPVVA